MRSALAGAGVAFVIVPSSVFDSFADTEWEVGIVRMAGPLLVAIAGVWSWVSRTGGRAVTRFYGWVLPGLGLLTVYLLSSHPVFLIFGFCALFAGAANLWLFRAHIAAESLRASMERRLPG